MNLPPALCYPAVRHARICAALAFYAAVNLWVVVAYVVLQLPPERLAWLYPWCGVAAAGLMLAVGGRRIVIPLLWLAAAGIAVELLGVQHGLFGAYSYSEQLGCSVAGVPLAMGFAWAGLLCYTGQLLTPLRLSPVARAALGALWMTALDTLIDPLASGPLSCWSWHGGGWYYGVPWTNFASWFGVSFVLLLILGRFQWTSRGILLIGLSVIASMGLLALRQGMWPLVLISVVLQLAHLAVEQSHPAGKRLLRWQPRPQAQNA